MLSVQLAQLIERHADSLTHEVVEDLLSNAHTISDVEKHARPLSDL